MKFTVLEEAILFATKAHKGQFRDGPNPLPYIAHPIEVLNLVSNVGNLNSPTVRCAAILHDVLEHTETSRTELRKAFDRCIVDLVEQLTREEPKPKLAKSLSKQDLAELRSNMMLEEIKEMTSDAKAIKLADRLSNIKEAKRTRTGKALDQYRILTARILNVIEPSINPALYEALQLENGN